MLNFVIANLLLVSLISPQISEARAQFEKSDFDPSVMKINEDSYLGKTVPDIRIIDESGNALSLGSFSKKPLLLLLIYFECPYICPLLGEGLADALDNIKDLKSGSDYNVLVLSFDQNDTPEKAREYRKKLQRQLKFAGMNEWVFATAKEEDIKSITESAGYRFYSAEDKTFVHPSVFIFLSPDRKITRYIFGIKPDPFTIRLAILESVTGRIGKVPVSSLVTLACYKYDSETHEYILNLQVLFASIGVVLAVMTGILSVIVYRKKKSLKIGKGG